MTSEEIDQASYFKNYLILWSSQLVSILGSSIVMFVIVWQIGEIAGDDNTLLSVAMFMGFVPMVIFSPIAGIVADRFDKKKIIIISDSLQALFTLVLIILIMVGQIKLWHLFMINFIRGVCQAFHEPTSFSLIPLMVPKDKLTQINGLQFLFSNLMLVIGPVIAAALLIIWDIGDLLWLDIITFAIALIIILSLKLPKTTKKESTAQDETESAEKSKNRFLTDFKEGIQVILSIPGLLSLLVMAVFSNFFIQPLNTLQLNFIKYEHFGGKDEFALFSAVFQAGAFTGAIIVALKKKWKNTFTITSMGILSLYVFMIILGLVPSGNFWALYVTGFFMILMNPIINSIFQSMVQIRIPPDKMGRVISVIIALSSLLSPIGMIISGPIADALGSIKMTYIIAGSLGLIVTCFTLFNKKVIRFVKESEDLQYNQEEE